MKEGREVGRRPRKRTERVLSLTSDSDEHFLAARALRPPRAHCPPCSSTDTDTSESASSFLSAAFYSNKEELSAKVERERERSRSPQLPSYRLERESTSAAAEGRREGGKERQRSRRRRRSNSTPPGECCDCSRPFPQYIWRERKRTDGQTETEGESCSVCAAREDGGGADGEPEGGGGASQSGRNAV